MSDNQKIIFLMIIVCSIMAIWVGTSQLKPKKGNNYMYYITTSTVETDFNHVDGYKISSNIPTSITDEYVRLGLSALIDYNLNIKNSENYAGSELFTAKDSSKLSNDFIITTAINLMYKSNLLLPVGSDEKTEMGATYKTSSISLDYAIKTIFGNVNYTKQISTKEVFYNKENDTFFYNPNTELSSIGDNHIKAKIEEYTLDESKSEIVVSIAYLNYKENKVYENIDEKKVILDQFEDENVFQDDLEYLRYKITFETDGTNQVFKNIEKYNNES